MKLKVRLVTAGPGPEGKRTQLTFEPSQEESKGPKPVILLGRLKLETAASVKDIEVDQEYELSLEPVK